MKHFKIDPVAQLRSLGAPTPSRLLGLTDAELEELQKSGLVGSIPNPVNPDEPLWYAKERRLPRVQRLILQHLSKIGYPQSMRQLAEALGYSQGAIWKALTDLRSKDLVFSTLNPIRPSGRGPRENLWYAT